MAQEAMNLPCPRYDFHLHTKYLGCANETMEVGAIVAECERLGVTRLAITDHLNDLEQLPRHRPILRDLRELETQVEVYFGVELNFTGCDEGFPFNEEIKEQYGFQFAIGGIHSTYLKEYDLRKLIDIQHRHHLRTCEDPLVQVLVHPYWFSKREFKEKGFPPFESLQVVPEAYVRELGQVARETGTAIEINACANLQSSVFGEDYVRSYVDFLAILAAEGATFSLGSDAHDISQLATIRTVWEVVEQLHLPQERIWTPEGEPIQGFPKAVASY
ncbi:MAG TPA: PHP domain-containing protein [Armatimonadetes bacterium]|nr:PHP domain-containing protein [Armatimonadota bacterium]